MISIIGAGPSGSYLAYLLARMGKKVRVFEEHNEIGRPVQCTGLVTSSIEKLIDVQKDFVVNTLYKIRVFAPDGNFVDFALQRPNYVFDRCKFDQYLARLAQKEGAEYFYSKKFVDFSDGEIRFVDSHAFETEYLVGADGPLSSVAKSFDLFQQRRFMVGMQARVRGHFVSDTFFVYLGEGYFGWSVPESEEFSRVGVIVTKGHPKKYFKEILGKTSRNIVEYQSGLIPVYQPRIRCQKGNVFLVGDAATQCKGSTHGGIIQGMIAATALKEALVKGKNYDKLWRKKLGMDLYVHLRLREKLDSMSEKDLNYMIGLVKKERVKKVLETHDRDFASVLLFKLFLKEPRFLRFAI